MSSDQASLLLQLAFDARATEYFALASLTVVIFEWLISFRREVDLIWTRRKSLVKWLYIWNRYFALALISFGTFGVYLRRAPSDRACFIIQQVQGVTATIVFTTVDVILLLRIWILCERSRRALYVLMVLIIVEVIVMLCITALTVSNVAAFVHVGYVKGCYALVVPKYFAAFPVPSLILSCSMFCVTVRICHRRIAASRPYDTQSIIVVFLRDGLMWFLVVVLTNPPQIALWGWGRPSLIQVLMMPSFAAYSIIGARVLLNMMQITAEGATIEDEF